ncbi:MAG: septum formation initiator family protein [Clostridia bacterium]|nr:septum formation initiator family protein [Clostridia bacterium]
MCWLSTKTARMTMSNKMQARIKRRSFRWLNLLAILVVLFFCLRIGGQIREYRALQGQVVYYQDQLTLAQAEYDQQLKKMELLNNDSYIERMARERLGMVKEGEEVVSIVKIDLPDYVDNSNINADAAPEAYL